MKPALLCFTLLVSCLLPCAAQTKNSPTRLHFGPCRTTLHMPAPTPKALRPVTGGPFSDVPKDHWAAAAVDTLRRRGIVVGYPAGK